MSFYAVILCGGRGERFWPKSRRALPKQFIELFGRGSLTRDTSERVKRLIPLERQLFVTPADFGPIVRRQLRVGARNLVFEPVGRNTAPAIGLAAAYLARRDPRSTMAVLPADHLIENRAEFGRCLKLAYEVAQQGMLVTFGVPPQRPDTGYGYIKLGQKLAGSGSLAAHVVEGFREKPDLLTAQGYIADGNYAWNSGMFVWRTDAILGALERYQPELHAGLARFSRAIGTKSESAALKRFYAGVKAISIDYAVMERAENVAAVRATFDWDDVGSWLALERHIKPDAMDNHCDGAFVGKDAAGCIVDSDAGIVAALGVKDLVIVRAGDAVLVADRNRLDGIKEMLALIAADRKLARYL